MIQGASAILDALGIVVGTAVRDEGMIATIAEDGYGVLIHAVEDGTCKESTIPIVDLSGAEVLACLVSHIVNCRDECFPKPVRRDWINRLVGR